MRVARAVELLMPIVLVTAAPATAQRRTRGVYVDAGALKTIADLSGRAFLSGGLTVGGGLFWRPIATDSSLTVQGDFVWDRQHLHTTGTGSGTNVDLFLYGLNLDYIYWTHRKWALTMAAGGGAAVLHAWDTTGALRATPFARLGFGARYTANRRLQYFLQTFGIVYEIRNFPPGSVLAPYHRRQSGAGISVGAALGL